ncbi:MAG: hypothetical protein KME16_26555 [Scytolyngbya sp. HA4215-MV1]|nr:hypothetical protein [Scytolyngbya sp. HA4215-MV1]
MTGVFELDQSFVKSIDDKTARELVARLCRAELRGQSIPDAAVTWGGDQRAKDGGVDVRVDCLTPLQTTNFIKAEKSLFQVKAEKFPASKISQEMAPRGSIRQSIMELKETGGSYIIVSTRDDVSDEALQARRDAILQCLKQHGLEGYIQFDFYDSRRIADWVELHPSITTWLRHKVGQPLKGWQPYGPWAYGEDQLEAEYLIDDRVRVFVPSAEEGCSITDAISKLRQELKDGVSIRIIGLSGVGKTRLVQALFDARVCSSSVAPSSENVIYADLADEPEPQPQTMLNSLLNHQSDSIVIVDNCGPDTHEQLTRIVKRKGSCLKLITVEYDIRDDLPEDTLCYRLEGSSLEIITKLLKLRYQQLSNNDAERIAEFSDGNARVAFALASTVETGGEISRLRNQELFERLFHQKNDLNDELLRCAEAASLLYSFDGSDVSSNGEIARLASFAEVTPLTFLRHTAELKRRGLLQERGKWRAVLPHAIANGLAKRMLESVPRDYLYNVFIEQGGERIARSFSRRLGFLHDCSEAVAIADRMLASSGKFRDLTTLTAFEQQMFVNLAPLNPGGALNAIERATAKSNFLSVDNYDRARFARVVRSIAYDPKYFDQAALILRKFALAEPENYKNDPVRDIFKSLFYCYLSGTQAGPEQRCKVVLDLVSSCSGQERKLGLDLVSAGLEAGHFSAHYGFEFGARRRDYGWHPKSQIDVQLWYRSWIDLVAAIGEQENEYGQQARTILGEALRGLWGRVGLDDELVDVAKRLSAIDGWMEGWLGARRVLQWDAKSLLPTSLAKLREIEKMLAPSDLVSEIRARVLAHGSFAYDLDDEDESEQEDSEPLPSSEIHRRLRMKAETLGATAVNSPSLLETLIPDLCSTSRGSGVYEFGRGIGGHHANITQLLGAVRTHLEHANRSNLSLIWVRGLLAGWMDINTDAVEEFLDDAIDDAVWREWFVELQVQSNLNTKAVDRLLRVLDSGHCPTWQFCYLATGRATDPLTISQIMAISNKLALRADHGLFRAIDLLAMVIHCTDKKDERYKHELGKALLEFLNNIDWSLLNAEHAQIDHDLSEVLKFALKSAESENQVRPILSRMLPRTKAGWLRYNDVRKNALKPFFMYFPKLALELVCIPDEDGTLHRASQIVYEPYFDRGETALGLVPTEVLIKWCNEKPETRYAFAAESCKLFENQSDEKIPLVISNTAVALLEAAPDKKVIVETLVRRFQPSSWSGSRADILEARLPLLNQLVVSNNEAVSSAVRNAKETLLTWIKEQRAYEMEREKSGNSSFE